MKQYILYVIKNPIFEVSIIIWASFYMAEKFGNESISILACVFSCLIISHLTFAAYIKRFGAKASEIRKNPSAWNNYPKILARINGNFARAMVSLSCSIGIGAGVTYVPYDIKIIFVTIALLIAIFPAVYFHKKKLFWKNYEIQK